MSLTSDILHKLRRAYRNKEGTHFSADELGYLAKIGVLHLLAKAEADELVATLDGRPMARAKTHLSEETSELPRAFTVKTLAERWDCSEGLIRKLVASGDLKSFRYGNMIRVTREAVLEREAVR